MKYIGIIGGRLCDEALADVARRAGAAVAQAGCVLVCGGMGGVMEHACRGAQEAGGVTIGILPTTDRYRANPYLTYSIPTGIGEARNSIVIRSSDGVVAIGGSFGTLSEIAFACLFEKPIVGINTWNVAEPGSGAPIIPSTGDPEEAVALVCRLVEEEC